jgi:hypothetical protein
MIVSYFNHFKVWIIYNKIGFYIHNNITLIHKMIKMKFNLGVKELLVNIYRLQLKKGEEKVK